MKPPIVDVMRHSECVCVCVCVCVNMCMRKSMFLIHIQIYTVYDVAGLDLCVVTIAACNEVVPANTCLSSWAATRQWGRGGRV